jgi:DNA invertase Pin-like site-specific DNA recombinase
MSKSLAVAYIRTSTAKQEISPKVQLERIHAYCEMRGLEIVETISEHVSARSKPLHKRPEGSRIKVLTDTGVRHVVALKLDRIFRNAADALVTVRSWTESGIALHLVDMAGISIDTNSSMGTLFLTLLAAFGEFEANLIRERTSAALRHKKSHGEAYNHAPYGSNIEDGKLVANVTEQAVIARMATLREQGVSYGRIADSLNADDVPTKRNAAWGAQTVKNILELSASKCL